MSEQTINRETFPDYIAEVFERATSRLEDGWDRAMLLKEFSERELDAVLEMHEAGYGAKGRHAEGFDPGIGFWMDLYDSWLEWEPGDDHAVEGQRVPHPGEWVQRPGNEPTRAVRYYPVGTFRVMSGDEKLAWLTTEDGRTSAEGTYRVLGYRDGEG